MKTRDELRKEIADAAASIRSCSGCLRREGFEFLIAAREWLRLGYPALAEVAIYNARTVLRPFGPSEIFVSSRK